jgi:aminoglycoside phosphotransferase (APT) family kinase protein
MSSAPEVQIDRIIKIAFPNRTIRSIAPLTGGLINRNFKIEFAETDIPIVLRLYRDGPEVCRKEVAIHNLIGSEVPVPRVLHAEPEGLQGSRPFIITEYVDGITFQQLKRTNNLEAINQAAHSVGKTLATIGRFEFDKPGRLVVGKSGRLEVGTSFVEGDDQIPRLLDSFLSSPNCERRAGSQLIDRIHQFVWARSDQLLTLNGQRRLVHSDFGNRNILVREENGKWVVAAVVDWEFGFSGSSLLDVGNFLRYELRSRPLREPHFSRAFLEHGGQLPENWQKVVRIVDLIGLVELLTHEELPNDVEAEVIALIKATIEDRDWE